MATINFPNNRDQLNPPLPTGALQDGDKTNITADGVTITYIFKKPGAPNTDSWWKSAGRVNNATPLDKIEEGNTSAEVIDTGLNGQFVVSTEGAARMKVTSDGTVKLNGTNIDTDPSIQLNPDGSSVFGVNSAANGRINLRPNGTDVSLEVASGALNGNIWTLSNNGTIVANSSADATRNPNYKLDATDGSAEFSGDVTLDAGSGRGKILFGSSQEVFIEGLDVGNGGSTAGIFIGDETNGTSISLRANGSAEFTDTVAAPSFFGVGTGTAQIWYGGDTGASTITADGNATFDGRVLCGDGASASDTYGIVQPGYVAGRNASGDQVFSGALVGGTETSRINGDGSASFAGTVERKQTAVGLIPDTDGLIYGETIHHAYTSTNYRFTKVGWEYSNVGDRTVTWNIFDTKSLPKATNPDTITNWNPQISFGNAGLITLHGVNKGIQFGSTNSGGAITSQTLDDYEEGTFTPVYDSGLTVTSYDVQQGTYTKVGNLVTFHIRIKAQGTNTSSQAIIGDLPFSAGDASKFAGGAYLSFTNGFAGANPPHLWVGNANDRISFYKTTGGNWNGDDANGLANADLYIEGSYRTA